jgi:hypothetical protein
MNRILPKYFVLLLVLAILLTGTFVVLAQEGGGFSDTFDDATLPGWEHSQNVQVQDGALKISPDNFAFRNGNWSNPDFSVKFRMSESGGLVIHYHASDNGTYRVNVISEQDHTEINLEKEENEQVTPLANSMDSNLNATDWNTIKIQFSNGQHTVTLNDTQLFQVQDDATLPGGSIGFFVFGESAIEIDDLTLNSATGGGSEMSGEPQPGEEPMSGEELNPENMQGEGLPPASIQTTPMVTPAAGTGKRSFLEDLFVSGTNPLDFSTFVINLALSAILAFILGRVYIYWGASLSNRRKFAANFMLMSVTTTFIILVVRSSVALSLGLVGALSIVRFRAAIKEPEELAYLFLAIALGIGLGDNQRLVTLLAFSVAIIVLGIARLLRKTQADVNMHLNVITADKTNLSVEVIMQTLQQYCAKVKLLRYDENEKGLEYSFLVELRSVNDLSQARAALHNLSPSINITFLDNKGIW